MKKSVKDIKLEWQDGSMVGQLIQVEAWVKTKRESKKCTFLELSDGTTLKGIQVVINSDTKYFDYEKVVKTITTGCSIHVSGNVVVSPGGEQGYELIAETLQVMGESPITYPMQKKGHTNEYLRTLPHLRLRTNTISAVMRVRNACAVAIHQYFQQEGFIWAATPIITSNDAEGAGDMFSVTSTGTEDFFGKPAYLTVSGQLEGEAFATAFRNIYTFAPTFRAEKSKTTRHLSEFWMVEPEMSFCDLSTLVDVAEDFIKFVITFVLNNQQEEIEFFTKWVDKDLTERLKSVK